MSKKVEIALPKLGESITSATVVKWLKNVGDHIRLDDPLVEVSTDKVNSEIPSPVEGRLSEIVAVENQEIEVGAPLAYIETKGEATEAKVVEPMITPSCQQGKETVFSPAVLRMAEVEGIPFDKLRHIKGTGEGGRVSKKDLESYLTSQKVERQPAPTGDEERIKLSGMRKAIADNMVRSFYQAPHASLVTEIDVTDVMNLISREKHSFLSAHGVKLTITSFLMQALAKALQQYPMLNASMGEEEIVLKRYINIGIAVHIDGGLMVPVVKNCQERNLVSLAKEVADLSTRAREGKLSHNEVASGTITLTNFGMTGATMGVPIIRYPEVAIVGAGAIKKRVVVKEDDSFAIRQMMYVTLTFDHRVIDGIYGCEFLSAFKQSMESIV